jgi:hypothetical protein
VGTLFSNGGADTAIESLAKRKIPRGAGLMGVMEHMGSVGLSDIAVDTRHLILSG